MLPTALEHFSAFTKTVDELIGHTGARISGKSYRTAARIMRDGLFFGIQRMDRITHESGSVSVRSLLRTLPGDELYLSVNIKTDFPSFADRLEALVIAPRPRDKGETVENETKNPRDRLGSVTTYLANDGRIYLGFGEEIHTVSTLVQECTPGITVDSIHIALFPPPGHPTPSASGHEMVKTLKRWVGPSIVHDLSALLGGAQSSNQTSIVASASLDKIAGHLQFALEESGLRIPAPLTRSFLTALATKRFAILTGLSGSGKTQIALRLGEWFGQDRFLLQPVRPDWTSPENLLGYQDALTQPDDNGRRPHHAPDVLRFILKAKGDQNHPYLLILDEMNLAHVERYFADILSGLESDKEIIPNVEQSSKDGLYWPVDPKKPLIALPKNLFIVGTVNVDETTYMFSPKVLDRANTFEFRVSHKDLDRSLERPKPCDAGPEALVQSFLAIAQDDAFLKDHPSPHQKEFANKLTELHKLLAKGDWEFGHRVFYEANRFAALLTAAGAEKMEDALDAQLMQKILPRLHGNRRKLEATLCALGIFSHDLSYDAKASEADQIKRYKELEDELVKKPDAEQQKAIMLPVSHNKINRMLKNLRANQFASFTE